MATVVSEQRMGPSGQRAQPTPLARRGELGPRDALDVVARQLAVAFELQRLGVFVRARKQKLEPHAQLPEKLLAARALRREIHKVAHGSLICIEQNAQADTADPAPPVRQWRPLEGGAAGAASGVGPSPITRGGRDGPP
jgi:hypothetical protein